MAPSFISAKHQFLINVVKKILKTNSHLTLVSVNLTLLEARRITFVCYFQPRYKYLNTWIQIPDMKWLHNISPEILCSYYFYLHDSLKNNVCNIFTSTLDSIEGIPNQLNKTYKTKAKKSWPSLSNMLQVVSASQVLATGYQSSETSSKSIKKHVFVSFYNSVLVGLGRINKAVIGSCLAFPLLPVKKT